MPLKCFGEVEKHRRVAVGPNMNLLLNVITVALLRFCAGSAFRLPWKAKNSLVIQKFPSMFPPRAALRDTTARQARALS